MRLGRFLGLCFEEAVRGLWFYRRIVAPSMLVMIVSLTVLGAFLLVSENLNAVLVSWRERGQLQVFLRDDVSSEQRAAMEDKLHRSPAIKAVRYLDAEDAAKLFRTDFSELGEVLDLLEENPLPASYVVTIAAEMRSERVLSSLSDELAAMEGVDGVQYDLQIIRRLELGVRSIRLVGLLLGGTVLLAALITTANVVGVLVVSRAREIDTMRLVGASERVVLGRFLVEGALQGMFAGLFAVLFLYVAYRLGLSYLDRGEIGFLAGQPLAFLRPEITLALLAGGALTGVIGSWLAFGPGGLRSQA